MVKKRKTTVKRTKLKNKSKWNLSRRLLLVGGVVVFGLVGAYFVSASRADSPKSYNKSPNAVVIEIRQEKPLVITKDSGSITGLKLRLYGDGTLVCADKQVGFLQANLSEEEVQTAMDRIYATGVTKTKTKVSNLGENVGVSDFTSVTMKANNKKYRNEYHNGIKPAAYNKLDSVIGSLCNQVEQPTLRIVDPSPSNEASEPVEVDNAQASIWNRLFPRAHAMTIYTLGNDNFSELQNINEARQNRGKGRLFANECLSKVARDQARRMAEKGTLYHNPQLGGDINRECNGWWGVGENVGYVGPCDYQGYDDCEKRMFKAYMDSEGHKKNLLNDDWKYVGVGSYRTSKGTLWTAQVFGRCAPGCSAKWGNGIPRVNTGANVTNLNSGQTVKPGDVINVRVSFKNFSDSAPLVDKNDGKIRFQGIVPNGTTLESIDNTPHLFRLTNGNLSDPSHTHDLRYPVKRIVWEFSRVAPDGNRGSEWDASYIVRVNQGVDNGKLLCFHSDIFGGDNNLLTTSNRSEVCHKVAY